MKLITLEKWAGAAMRGGGMKGLCESAAQRRIAQQAAGTRVVTHKPSGQRYLVAMEAGGVAELIPIGGRSMYVKTAELDESSVWE